MKKILVLAACMVFLMAGVADAYFYLEGSVAGGVGVTITDPGGTGGTTAGRFTVDFGPSQGTAISYQAFCVDWATIGFGQSGQPFFMIDIPANLTPYKQAAYVFDKYGYANPALAQIAIWELVFEGLSAGSTSGTLADLKPTAGKFYVNSGISDADLTTAAGYVLDALTNGANFTGLANYRLLVSSNTVPPPSTDGFYGNTDQDFIVRMPVPEPMSMILLGLGLVGLGAVGRKRS